MTLDRCVLPAHQGPFEPPELGHPVLDRYLTFVAARCRPNTVLAAASDLKAFCAVVAKEPTRSWSRTCWPSSTSSAELFQNLLNSPAARAAE